jgi:hypothetical protein
MSRSTSAQKLCRRNILLPESSGETVTEIRRKTDAQSDSEVFRRALKLYDLLLDDNVEFVLKEKTTGKEKTIIPF